MKKFKPINFNSTNIFYAIFTTMFLFILEIATISMFVKVIDHSFLSHSIVYIIFITAIFILEKKTLIKMFKSLKDDIKQNKKSLLIVTISLFIFVIVSNLLLIKLLGHKPTNDQVIIAALSENNIVIFLIYSVILSPIIEALLYFYPYKNIKNKVLACIVSSVIFALFHLTTSNNALDLLFLIPYLAMSFMFTYGFFKTNNIYLSIITHAINNLIAFVLLFIM